MMTGFLEISIHFNKPVPFLIKGPYCPQKCPNSNNENAMTKSSSNDANNDANDNNGYESLWEVGLAKNIQGGKFLSICQRIIQYLDDLIPEVEEIDEDTVVDQSQDVNHEDIYENTGVFNQNFTLSVGE